MDIITSTLILKNIDCFVASETWFQQHHTESMTHIPGYVCYRDDRTDRVGGGVGIWSKHAFCPERIPIVGKPDGIEMVAVKLNS